MNLSKHPIVSDTIKRLELTCETEPNIAIKYLLRRLRTQCRMIADSIDAQNSLKTDMSIDYEDLKELAALAMRLMAWALPPKIVKAARQLNSQERDQLLKEVEEMLATPAQIVFLDNDGNARPI